MTVIHNQEIEGIKFLSSCVIHHQIFISPYMDINYLNNTIQKDLPQESESEILTFLLDFCIMDSSSPASP